MSETVELVLAFCKAWSRRDVEEVMGYFTEGAIYHNMPMPPLKGKPAIRAIIAQIMAPASLIDWEILNVAESGSVVFTERVDRFQMGERKVELPVAGVFEIDGGKIVAWRDYFDMAAWTRQTSG